MTRSNDKELKKLKHFCRNIPTLHIAIVSTHWNHDGSRAAEQNSRFNEAQADHWKPFIKAATCVQKLTPKPSDSPFKCNPIDAAEAWNILLSIVDGHASTDRVSINMETQEPKQEKRRRKLAEAMRSGNVLKIIFYSVI
jgi:hypothetical protein